MKIINNLAQNNKSIAEKPSSNELNETDSLCSKIFNAIHACFGSFNPTENNTVKPQTTTYTKITNNTSPLHKALLAWENDKRTKGNKTEAMNRIIQTSTDKNTHLDLSGLELESLPDVELPHVQTLTLDDNHLTAIPASFNLPHLNTLFAARNELTEVPVHFDALEQLFLSENKINSLPDSCAPFEKLDVLYVNGNPLIGFPQDFALPNLTRLYAFKINNLTLSTEQLKKQCPKLYIVETDS